MQRKYRGFKGFTLVEVLVSLMVFLVASMGLVPLLITSLQTNGNTSLYSQARRLTGELMAEMQVIDYAGLAMVHEEPVQLDAFELQRQVERNLPQTGQCRLTVTARWQTQGRRHNYQLQTIRSAP